MKTILAIFLFFSMAFATEIDCYKLEFQDTVVGNKIEAYFYPVEIENQHVMIIAAVKIGTNELISVPNADNVTNWCNFAWTPEFAEWAGCKVENNTLERSRLFEILIYTHQVACYIIFKEKVEIPTFFPDAKPKITK